MELLIALLVDIFVTAIAYLLVPIIIIFTEKRYALSKIKKIVIINGLCVWLIFTIVRIELGIDGTSLAVFLWSYVAYLMMKKKCLKNDDTNEPINTAQDDTRTLTTDSEKKTILKNLFIESSGVNTHAKNKTNAQIDVNARTENKANYKNIIIIALSILLAISIIFNIIQLQGNGDNTMSQENIETSEETGVAARYNKKMQQKNKSKN